MDFYYRTTLFEMYACIYIEQASSSNNKNNNSITAATQQMSRGSINVHECNIKMVQESVVGAESTYYLRFQIATSDCCVDRGSRYYCQRIILVWSVYVCERPPRPQLKKVIGHFDKKHAGNIKFNHMLHKMGGRKPLLVCRVV